MYELICLSKRDRQAKLLRWYRQRRCSTGSLFVSMDEFDYKYSALFGKQPLWYSEGPFYRDHGCVGLVRGRKYGHAV